MGNPQPSCTTGLHNLEQGCATADGTTGLHNPWQAGGTRGLHTGPEADCTTGPEPSPHCSPDPSPGRHPAFQDPEHSPDPSPGPHPADANHTAVCEDCSSDPTPAHSRIRGC